MTTSTVSPCGYVHTTHVATENFTIFKFALERVRLANFEDASAALVGSATSYAIKCRDDGQINNKQGHQDAEQGHEYGQVQKDKEVIILSLSLYLSYKWRALCQQLAAAGDRLCYLDSISFTDSDFNFDHLIDLFCNVYKKLSRKDAFPLICISMTPAADRLLSSLVSKGELIEADPEAEAFFARVNCE
jgi:hypothetical protein